MISSVESAVHETSALQQCDMDDATFQKLEEHHQRIRAGIDEVRRYCEAVTPDLAGLGDARLRLSRASIARSKFYAEEVMLKLKQSSVYRGELAEVQRAFSAKRLKSSEHVVRWSSSTIAADWPGYRKAAQDIWAMMEEQMDREVSFLRKTEKDRHP